MSNVFPSAHLHEILSKALLSGPTAFIELVAIRFCFLVFTCRLVEICCVMIKASTCLVGVIYGSALVKSVRHVRGDDWWSVEGAAARINIAPLLAAPLGSVRLLAIRMSLIIPCFAGASCLCWVFMLFALCDYRIQYTIASVDTNAAAIAHAPCEAMELLCALSEDLLAQAYLAVPAALVNLRAVGRSLLVDACVFVMLRSPRVFATTRRIRVIDRLSLIGSFWQVRTDLGRHRNIAVTRIHVAPFLGAPSVAEARLFTFLAAWMTVVIPGLASTAQLQGVLHI